MIVLFITRNICLLCNWPIFPNAVQSVIVCFQLVKVAPVSAFGAVDSSCLRKWVRFICWLGLSGLERYKASFDRDLRYNKLSQ